MNWIIEEPRLFLAKGTWEDDAIKIWVPLATKPKRVTILVQLLSYLSSSEIAFSDAFAKRMTDLVKKSLVDGLRLTSKIIDTERFEDYSLVKSDFIEVLTEFSIENGPTGNYTIGDPLTMDIRPLNSYTDEMLDRLQYHIATGHQVQAYWDRGSVAPLQAPKTLPLWN